MSTKSAILLSAEFFCIGKKKEKEKNKQTNKNNNNRTHIPSMLSINTCKHDKYLFLLPPHCKGKGVNKWNSLSSAATILDKSKQKQKMRIVRIDVNLP